MLTFRQRFGYVTFYPVYTEDTDSNVKEKFINTASDSMILEQGKHTVNNRTRKHFIVI